MKYLKDIKSRTIVDWIFGTQSTSNAQRVRNRQNGKTKFSHREYNLIMDNLLDIIKDFEKYKDNLRNDN